MELIKVELDNINGVLVTTSNRVAKELKVNHFDLLDKIKNYIKKFSSQELSCQFYIPSTYKASNGRTVKNYLITKKGIAQLIGGYSSAVEKAFDLNVAYINKFEEMENELRSIKESKYKELENLQINSMKDFKYMYSSLECVFMLLEEINEDQKKIEKTIANITDHRVHTFLYLKQSVEKLKKLQKNLNII